MGCFILLVVAVTIVCATKRTPFVFRKSALVGSFSLLLLPSMQAATTPAATTTALTLSSPEIAQGTLVTLTASVAASGPVTVGQVNFCDAAAAYCTDIHLLGTAQLTSAGTAVLKLFPGIGNHSYKAVFAGTNSAAASASTERLLTATGTNATTSVIAQSGSAGNYTLTATVTGAAVALPTGTVSFLDTSNGNESLATAPLGTGATTLNLFRSWTSTGDDAYGLGVGDFNGDGKMDFAVPNLHNNTVTVLLGNGDGTFTPGVTLPTGYNPIAIAVGDFNGDGNADMAVSNLSENSVTILLGNGDGTFNAAAPLPTGQSPQYIFLADLNGDGKLDLAVPNYSGNTVTVWLGNGDGTFTAAPNVQGGGGPDSLALGDLNGDGKPDMVIANYDANTMTVLLGNGDGTFTPMATGSLPVDSPGCLVLADINGDGKADLAVVDSNSNAITILLGNGDGTFTPAQTLKMGAYPVYAAAGDFNGDGKVDLSVVNQRDSNVMMLLGNGDGTFKLAATVATGYLPFQIAVGDFNGDGVTDVVTANDDHGQATVLLTQLTQAATALASSISPDGIGNHLIAASYPGDGNYASSTSSTTSLTAQPTTTSLALNANSTGSTYGQQVLLTATLSPYTVQGQSTNGQTVSFYNGSTRLGTAPLSNGVAMLNAASLPAGTNSLTASFAAGTGFSASTSSALSYTVSSESTITFSVQNHTYGDAPFVVGATSNSSGAVTYSVVSGPATVSASMVTLTGAGTVVLKASLAANGNYSAATQNAGFTVAGSAPSIVFTIPNHTYGDAPFAVSATSNSPGAISYSIASGPAIVSGSTVTLNGTGTVLLSVNLAASGNFAAATEVARFTVAGSAPTLTLSVPNHTYGDAPFAVSASSNSSGAITYAVVSGPATIFSSMVTLTGVGPVVLSASQAANGNYAAATRNASFTVAGSPPVVTLAVPDHTYGDGTFALSATSNSKGPITYAVVSGPATLSVSTVTLTGAGTVMLSASQAASGNYAATITTTSIIVEKAATTTTLTQATGPATNTGAIILNAQVQPATSGMATGSVRFFNGKVPLGESTLDNGVAAFSTNLLQAAASNPLTAVYQGDANFVPSASSDLPVQVSASGFWVKPANGLANMTVQGGMPAVFPLQVSPGNAGIYPGVVTFSVAGLPAGATAIFSPATLAPESGARTVSLTVQTSSAGPATTASVAQRLKPALGEAVLALVLLPLARARRLRKAGRGMALALLLILGGVAGGSLLTGCGVVRNGNSSGTQADQQPTSYLLTVTVSSGGVQHATMETLVIQP